MLKCIYVRKKTRYSMFGNARAGAVRKKIGGKLMHKAMRPVTPLLINNQLGDGPGDPQL